MDNHNAIDPIMDISQYEKNIKNAILNLKTEHSNVLSGNDTEATFVSYPFISKKKHVLLDSIIESDVLITPYNPKWKLDGNNIINNWPSALIGVPHEKIVVLDNIESNGGLWRFVACKSKELNKDHSIVLIQFCEIGEPVFYITKDLELTGDKSQAGEFTLESFYDSTNGSSNVDKINIFGHLVHIRIHSDTGCDEMLCCNCYDSSIELLSSSQYAQAIQNNPHYTNIWDVFVDDISMFNDNFLPNLK